jgi:hypothetical protein
MSRLKMESPLAVTRRALEGGMVCAEGSAKKGVMVRGWISKTSSWNRTMTGGKAKQSLRNSRSANDRQTCVAFNGRVTIIRGGLLPAPFQNRHISSM